jgi:hypothetical protein
MTDPITPQDQFPRGHKLSHPAARALSHFKNELQCWDAYLESCSTSAAIELLTWFWREVRRERKTEVNPLKFRAETKRGRQPGKNQFRNLRPADHRLD